MWRVWRGVWLITVASWILCWRRLANPMNTMSILFASTMRFWAQMVRINIYSTKTFRWILSSRNFFVNSISNNYFAPLFRHSLFIFRFLVSFKYIIYVCMFWLGPFNQFFNNPTIQSMLHVRGVNIPGINFNPESSEENVNKEHHGEYFYAPKQWRVCNDQVVRSFLFSFLFFLFSKFASSLLLCCMKYCFLLYFSQTLCHLS